MQTTIDTSAAADVAAVRAGFDALAHGNLDGLAAGFHPDATWNHRNDDRFGGIHHGRDAILAFIGESAQLTAGTLRVPAEAYLADGDGRVAALVRVQATRPDGRTFDDAQVLVFRVAAGQVISVDQHVGDPPTVRAFWA